MAEKFIVEKVDKDNKTGKILLHGRLDGRNQSVRIDDVGREFANPRDPKSVNPNKVLTLNGKPATKFYVKGDGTAYGIDFDGKSFQGR